MVDEMLQTMSGAQLSRGSGINPITIRKISRGENSRIRENVFEAIRKFYESHPSGSAHVENPRRAKQAEQDPIESGNHSPIDLDLISVDMISAEIARVEKRLEVLTKMLELVKNL